MRNAVCRMFVLSALVLVPVVSRAALVDTTTLPPAPPPKEHAKVEPECPPGSFKFEGTCWVQGDCAEGEAVFQQGICAPIPNWRATPPVEEQEAVPSAPADEESKK